MKSSWKQYLLYASLIILGGGLVFILVETVRAKNTGFEPKTLWDWMELLLIPLFLAGGAFFLNRSEKQLELQRAEERAKLERELATDRQQEAALQAYLDRMAELLLKDKLRTTKNKEVRNVVRARTLSVLRGLDAKRKGFVVLFLHEADLINTPNPIVDLRGADLSFADLSHARLTCASLIGVNLSSANLGFANMMNAVLVDADLSRARLNSARLYNANLSGTSLIHANLRGTNLSYGTKLNLANLSNADLSSANLSGTDLRDVSLLDADLSLGDLTGAIITDEQLADIRSLRGTTMPNGAKHN